MITILLLTGVCFFVSLPLITYWQMNRLPKNRPEKFKKQGGKKVVVLAGDSITHGQIGENYVAMLSNRLDLHQFNLVNAGINSHLAWNLLQRVNEIIACEPDFITIMIGTNDANAAITEAKAEEYVKSMDLPRVPDQDWYQESLYSIVISLQERTHAMIGLISIPPIGEDPDNFAFKISSGYVKSIKDVASSTGVTYLPFYEMMLESLDKQPGNPTYSIEKALLGMTIACFKRYILRKDWDSIGKATGFHLHIDYLHLNSKAASMVTGLIEDFIKENL